VATQGKLTIWINKLFPALADKLVFNHFLKEDDSPVRKYVKEERCKMAG
jgi:hypothetical protein